MFNNKSFRYILSVVLQLVLLLGLVAYKMNISTNGQEIYLKVLPVDPTDPLRGDFVTLRYDISQIHTYSGEKYDVGQTVYVPLYHSGQYWYNNGQIESSLPSDNNYYLYLKGTITDVSSYSNQVVPDGAVVDNYSYSSNETTYKINYGIEQYFIPEGAGKQTSLNNGDVMAKIVVDKNGTGLLQQVYIDKYPWPK